MPHLPPASPNTSALWSSERAVGALPRPALDLAGWGLTLVLWVGGHHHTTPHAADRPAPARESAAAAETAQGRGAEGAHAVQAVGNPDAPPAFTPPVYQILRVRQPPRIDGRLDEPAWFAAPAIDRFEFTWHREGAREQSVAKLLYDDEHLYVGHICQDAHITARHTVHDGPIPEDDCFEVIFAPDPTRPEVYFNIEWNVVGGYVDNHRPDGPNKPRAKVWDAEGVRIAGQHAGTLNDDTDRDESWTCEVAIPLKNFARHMPQLPPAPGSHWNLNLNRHGGQTNPQYSQWSRADTQTPSFHTPHRFGKAVFSTRSVPFDPAD